MSNRQSKFPVEIFPRTYRSSGFWKVALYVCSTLVAAGAAAGIRYSFVGQFHDLNGRMIMACVSFAFTALGGYVILWLIQSKTILYADRIEFKGVFSTKSFSHEDLRGWRVRPNLPPTLVLERKGGSSFKTSLVFRVDDEFSDWFESIPSLDN